MDKITVSYSEIDAYRQCPFKHYLAYGERFSKPVAVDSTLGKGTAWHEVLQVYYEAIQKGASAQEAYNLAHKHILTQAEEIQPMLKWMLDGYVSAYPKDALFWEIIAVESTIVAPLLDENGNETRFNLKAKADLIIRDKRNDLVSIIDHKSTSAHQDRAFDFDEQFGLYELVCNRAGYNVFNTVHSSALTKMNKGDLLKPGDDGYKGNMKETPLDGRFKRTPMKRTLAELRAIESDAVCTLEQIYSSANRRERHPSPRTCKNFCSYTEACLLGRRYNDNGRTIDMLEKTGFERYEGRH